jgi:hypothetical protein
MARKYDWSAERVTEIFAVKQSGLHEPPFRVKLNIIPVAEL